MQSNKGSVIVGAILIALIVIGAMLMTHTAAVIAVGNNARAFDVARQNSVSLVRLDRAVIEAAQNVAGISYQPSVRTFTDELAATLAEAPTGAASITISEAPLTLEHIRTFPDWAGTPAPLASPSNDLMLMANPEMRDLIGNSVSETDTVSVKFSLERSVVTNTQSYNMQVNLKLVSVPFTRYGAVPYNLTSEIGATSGSPSWPSTIEANRLAPLGLAPAQDPAHVATIETGPRRPGHYRRLAAMAEAYQYVFSNSYVQKVSDYCGATHFVQIGSPANPILDGGSQAGTTYTLDVGQFGHGRLGPVDDTKDAGVFWAAAAGAHLRLTDSGGATTPILILVAGPSNVAIGRLVLELQSNITRPIIVVGYNLEVISSAAVTLNGGLILDRDSFVAASAGPFTVGHVSYWSNGTVSSDAFRLGPMPAEAEALAPRVIYAVTQRSFL